MLLAIDVGNTHVVSGLYEGETLLQSWRLQSDVQRTVDEYALELLALLANAGYRPKDIGRIVLSSVVPALSRVFSKVSQKYFSIDPLSVGPGVRTGLEIHVDDPRSVGADRIVNALSAKALYGAPSIIVDFGTATTFDVVSEEGAYIGGVIAPGILISSDALFQRAALLPRIELKRPEKLLGKNTHDSLLSGIVFGYAGLVEGILERLKATVGKRVPVIATGGLAGLLAEEAKSIDHVVPDLTLHGLFCISQLNE